MDENRSKIANWFNEDHLVLNIKKKVTDLLTRHFLDNFNISVFHAMLTVLTTNISVNICLNVLVLPLIHCYLDVCM